MMGQTLRDRYLLEEELGRGGMGVVYRGRDTLLQRPVAVKVVSGGSLGTEGRARLLQEAQAAARLDHPNIVAVFDAGDDRLAGQTDPVTYIVMQLVDGRSLVNYRPDSIAQLLAIAIQICSALAAAHNRGITHRDLKPGNILLVSTDTVKLMDFGLAHIAGSSGLTQAGALMGTLAYMAPEIIQGQPAGVASDLYALGATLYELAAGRPPYEGDGPTAILSQHLYAPLVPASAHNEAVPPQLDALLAELLRKQPEDRPASAAEVERRLIRLRDQQTSVSLPAAEPLPQLQRLVRGRLVGREPDLAQATSLWQHAAAGDGQFLLVSGEPGIGKTRLARELVAYCEMTGGRALSASCYAEGGLPYQPLAELVRAILGNELAPAPPPAVMADLVVLAPDLRLVYSDVAQQPSQDPEAERARLFESVIALIQRAAQTRPLLLFIDDLHWADGGTLNFLRHLAGRGRAEPLMILATYREVELSANRAGQQLLRELDRAGLSTRLKLGRLDREQTSALLATLFDEAITPDFLAGIYRETEGNPFFIEELSKALIASGGLTYENGRWHRPAMSELSLPQSVRAAVEARLENLPEATLESLRLAALVGRTFDYDRLQAVSTAPEEALIDHLERAEQAQLVEEMRSRQGAIRKVQPRFAFTHALIHTTLVEGLSTLRRQRLQLHVAESLEAAFPDQRPELAPLLGRYFAEAGRAEKAVEFLLEAGDCARSVYDYDGAAAAYEQALVFLREGQERELTTATLMKLGLAYHSLLEFGRSNQAYQEAFSIQQLARPATTDLPPAPHPLRFESGIAVEPCFDPAKISTVSHDWYCQHFYSGLVNLSGDGDLLPDVAERWEVLDDGRRYIFYLRDDRFWTDGMPVTAGDFVFAWRRYLEPGRPGNTISMLYDILNARAHHERRLTDPAGLGFQALDDLTLEVVLEEPTGYFLSLLALGNTRPLPRHVAESGGIDWDDVENMVTNGPLVLKEWRPGHAITLARNPSFNGRYPGNVAEVVITEMGPQDALELYLEGELEGIGLGSFPPEVRRRLIQERPADYESTPTPCTWHIWFQQSRPPVDNPEIRRALVLAMDRDLLVARAADGVALPASGGLVPPGLPGHVPKIALRYDPEAARRALARSGIGHGQEELVLEIVIPMRQSASMEAIAGELMRQWRETLGIRLVVRSVELSQLSKLSAGELPHMWFLGWCADYPDPDSFLRVASWRTVGGWRHELYEQLMKEAKSGLEPESRLAVFHQMEEILVAEAPVVPLMYPFGPGLIQRWASPMPFLRTGGGVKVEEMVIRPH